MNEKSWRAAELQSLFTALAELRKKFKGRLRFSQAIWARLSNSVSITAATKRGRFRQRFPPGGSGQITEVKPFSLQWRQSPFISPVIFFRDKPSPKTLRSPGAGGLGGRRVAAPAPRWLPQGWRRSAAGRRGPPAGRPGPRPTARY